MISACSLLCALSTFAGAHSNAPEPVSYAERGIALGLFSADPQYRYRSLLEEIADTGATHVTIVWVWWQTNERSSDIGPVDGWSATDVQILDALETAKKLGLVVTAFPILRLRAASPGMWRGRITPDDLDAWWEGYDRFILKAAELSRAAGASRLSIGSELLTRERERSRWKRLIDRVRVAAPDLELMYSANWDHFGPVSFWDLVDVAGMTAYWELTKRLDAGTDDLIAAWKPVRDDVHAFAKQLGRPLVFTEVGYPSLDGGAAWPWDETRKAKVDLEEQRRGYAAFLAVWGQDPVLTGAYFWNWFGFGGHEDTNYTPRGKPAADLIRRAYRRSK